MKILVTGAAGYLGSILVPQLLEKDHEVTAVDSFIYNQTSLLDSCYNKKLKIVRGDARDHGLISRSLKDVDAIIPLACLTGAPLCQKDPTGAQTINYEAVKMLLDLRSKDQIIIFPTTNSGYGIGQEGVYCTEETPLKPLSLYGRLKTEIEDILLNAGNCITLRLATVFGISPRMRLDLLVNDFTYRAVTDRFVVLFEAHFKRNYIHVRDVARACRAAGLFTVMVTNGYITPAGLDALGGLIDVWRVDIKGFRSETYRRLCGVSDLQSITRAAERALHQYGMHVEVVTNLVPGINDSSEELGDIAQWIAGSLGPATPWHLTRFIPCLDYVGFEPTPLELLIRGRQIGQRAGLHHVYLGNIDCGEGWDTVCPKCGALVIGRSGYTVVETALAKGACLECNEGLGIAE